MQNGYYAATGGMVTQFNRLDVISNNLANLNTNSYKRDDVVIGDYMRLMQDYQNTLPIKDQTRDASKFINRTLDRVPIISEKYTDKSVGNLEKTDNSLDLALTKPNTYFVISTPDGISFTRNGSFSVSDEGYLVTKEGFKVLSRDGVENNGGILLTPSMKLNVDSDGNVNFKELTSEGLAEDIQGGALAIASFTNEKYLKKQGSSLYTIDKDESNNNKTDFTLLDSSRSVAQGFLEKSNVNAVIEMTSMIETNRLVDMYSKVMKTHMDDLNMDAINKLATRA